MTTTRSLPIARTDSNGTTWYPALPFGWTSNVALAAPHIVADAPTFTVERIPFVFVPAPVTTAVKGSHAACSHATTPAARKVCRAARKLAVA